ncbi:MAG: UDP-N-acetylmuramoyl-L-alanyl-D-glutamate--2,6-diaminopimelate ligase [Parachlamydiales bacterium]|nr:UDP-N-acetylmuramoyl-L-alanyl-D-glutamate--2,6-diaminopimelate ligase [Parachlamydiales bacterium]
MKLKKLLKDIPYKEVKGSKEVEITGICGHSKMVAPGNLFIAKRGTQYDGTQFIPDALSAGACAVVTDIYNPFLENCVQIICDDINQVTPLLSANYYQKPSDELTTIGITGTNGKTTTAYLIRHILETAHIPTGLMGTIEYIVGDSRLMATHTTPDVIFNHRLLREMITKGCQAAVMEVTSHALEQKRTELIDFDIAIFTNITQDHLDYHLTMEKYQQAKSLLFSSLKESSRAILNADDPACTFFQENTKAKIMTYGIHNHADVHASHIVMSLVKTTFTLEYDSYTEEISLPLIGQFNVYNALAAIATGIALGIPIGSLKEALASFPKVPGRMEKIPTRGHNPVFVDFAHTPDGLENALKTLRQLAEGKIICIFGCGGNRDASKREKMGRVASQYADVSIITTDNPRLEDPKMIAEQIAAGFLEAQQFFIELDRKEAIRKGLSLAEKKDIILIAGKGHELFQIFANKTVAFDDRQVVRDFYHEI